MTTTEQATLAHKDGCECPPWIIRCAHFNGTILTVTEVDLVKAEPGCSCATAPHSGLFSCGWMVGEWQKCQHGTPGFWYSQRAHKNLYGGHDRAAALDAFSEAEPLLLAGELHR